MVPVQMVQLVGPKAGVHKSSCHILVHAGGGLGPAEILRGRSRFS
jgi:hypothetical protein